MYILYACIYIYIFMHMNKYDMHMLYKRCLFKTAILSPRPQPIYIT